MSAQDDPVPPAAAAVTLEDVAVAAFAIAAGASRAERASRLLSMVRAWCEPSAVLGFVRDAALENGLRALPELSYGHAGPAPERSLARLLEDAGPERLTSPWLIPPPPEVAGYRVKALDSWLLPWSAPHASGFLLLRGVAAPYPPNLAQAVAVAAQGVWPLVDAPVDVTAQLARVDETARALQALVAGLYAAPELNSGAAFERGAPAPRAPGPGASPEVNSGVAFERGAAAPRAPGPGASPEVNSGVAFERGAAAPRAPGPGASPEVNSGADAPPRAASPDGAALAEAEHRASVAAAHAADESARREAAQAAQGQAESQRDAALAEVATWRARCDELAARRLEAPVVDTAALDEHRARAAAAQIALEAARAEVETLRETLGARDARLLELQAACEGAQAEAAASRERVAEALALSAETGDLDALRGELRAAREACAVAEGERDAGAQALEQARAREAELRTLLEAERLRRETDLQSLEGARQALKISEELLAGQTGELDALRRQRTTLHEQTEAAQRARAAAEAERDRARAEVNPLWATIESLQREMKDGQAGLQAESARLEAVRAELAAAEAREQELRAALAGAESRAADTGALELAERRAREAEGIVAALTERWDSGAETLRAAWRAFRRTPFVPPTLRLSFGSAQALFDPEAAQAAGTKRPRLLLLDRDTPSLEPLAAELEADGLDVLVAHYADEAAFFLKTPEARQLTALVADVMAFRSDAELLERFRAWRLDLPALGLLVSFRADDPAESERAKRVPLALGAGHLPRPLLRQALGDAVAVASKRAARPAPPR